MRNKSIPARRDVAEEYTWNLKDLYESDEAWFAEYEQVKELSKRFAAFQGRLGESAESLLEFLRLKDEVSLRLERLHGYARCKADQDIGEGKYRDMYGKAVNCSVTISSAYAFAAPEIMAIEEDRLNLFYIAQPELQIYQRSLYRIRRRAGHILTAAEERLLSAAGEMSEGPHSISNVFSNADLQFPPVEDENGEKHDLTTGTLVPLLESSDRTLRRNTFTTFYERVGEFRNTSAAMLDAQFKQLRFFSEARNYSSTLEASLDRTEVPVAVYTNLVETVHANLDKMYRYVNLRRRLLGVDELHMYDVYTPIVAEAAENVPFEQAKTTVLEALSVLGEDYTAMLREGFENRWIDVYENRGKRSGAYSSGAARPHPYVLLNYKNNLSSMFTLAHEMGHSLHSYHSCRYQPVCTSNYVIFVAEVASTCNEVLLMHYLLNRTGDKKKRAYLINHFLDKFKGTLFRQTMFAEFEREVGILAGQGETLTADRLCEKYLAVNRLYFGPDMVSDPEIALEWARIPHFYYNYYVFQYATGFSAAVAIADRILREGETAVKDYKRFLSGGSSADPITLLKYAGVDMSSTEPVTEALRFFGELVDEMEKLA